MPAVCIAAADDERQIKIYPDGATADANGNLRSVIDPQMAGNWIYGLATKYPGRRFSFEAEADPERKWVLLKLDDASL